MNEKCILFGETAADGSGERSRAAGGLKCLTEPALESLIKIEGGGLGLGVFW